MRQRLGLANALIGNPAAPILSSPPTGSTRPASTDAGLLRGFATGATAPLSSHLPH